MRRTIPVLAAACAAVALAFVLVADGSAPAQAPPTAKPNVVVVMTDDQTVEQMRRARARAHPHRARGDDLRAQLQHLSALLPVALDLPHRPVLPQPPRAVQPAAGGRLRQARLDQHAAGVAAGGRLRHRARRQVPQRLRHDRPARRATGVVGVVGLRRSDDLQLLQLLPERERQPGQLRRRPGDRQGLPGRRSTARGLPGRRLHGQGGRLHRPARGVAAALLPLCRLPGPAQRRSQRAAAPLRGLGQARPAPPAGVRRTRGCRARPASTSATPPTSRRSSTTSRG